MFIQRVWRRHHEMKLVALRLQWDWEIRMNEQRRENWSQRQGLHDKLLQSYFGEYNFKWNFCSMATGSIEEKTIWFHLSKRLIFVCSFVLSMFEYSHQTVQDVALTSTAMHLSVLLKDPKSWNSIADNNRNDANTAVKILVQFIGSKRSGLYSCIRKFISKFSSQELKSCQTDGIFLIVASAITLSLQPYHITNMDLNDDVMMECAVEQYCVSVLTIPWFPQRLPAILVPALRHKSVLLPCLRMLLAFWSGLEHRASEADSGHYRNGLRTDSQQIWSEERGPVCDVVSVVIVCGGSYRRGKASCGDMDIVKRHHDGKKCGLMVNAETYGTEDGSEKWGYVDVRPGAHMFWWYYKSPNRIQDSWPIILWLQGGPAGSSGVRIGNFQEIGPLDTNLKTRDSTWLKKADLLFVDSPVGTGYSYVENASLLVKRDEEAAAYLTTLLIDVFNRNESLQKSPLYIVGESYGGKHVVTLGLSAL